MILAESPFLRTCKAEIERLLGITQHETAAATQTMVRIEPDDRAPSDAAITFIAVCPGGTMPGPRHNTAGGIYDLVYAVDVVVFRRITNVPADRHVDPFLYHSDALNATVEQVIAALDYSMAWLDRVNELLEDEAAGEQGFLEALKFTSIDPKPRVVTGADYGADQREPRAGMKRRITFGDARRIHTRS